MIDQTIETNPAMPRLTTPAGNRPLLSGLQAILDYSLWPALLCFSLGGVYVALRVGHSPGVVLFAQSVMNILILALLEALRPERREWALHSDRSVAGDLIHSIAGSVLAGNVGRVLLSVLIALVAAEAAGQQSGSLWLAWSLGGWPIAAQFLVFLLYMECASYWWHRLMHLVPVLWRFHYIHHNPTRMHVLKAGRVHWFSGIVGTMLKFALPVALGAPPALFIAYAAATNIFGTLTHANFRHRIPGFVHYVLNTAGVHHLHHSTRMDLGNSNFGNILSVWDVVFGSFRHPDENRLERVGVTKPAVRDGLVGELIGPLIPGGLLSKPPLESDVAIRGGRKIRLRSRP
ncbi:MAG: sterol desaturase family protein [Leptospirales bacterium]|jgi:sterol desaturase/sphingolipid hydroxylase (fatty acid hydroxylase superfamily)